MSTILHLQKRNAGKSGIQISRSGIEAMKAAPDATDATAAAALWRFVNATVGEALVHDKDWLEMIVNWVPAGDEKKAGGLSVTEQARWLELAMRVNRLDDNKTGKFTLSASQGDLIFKRLCDARFILTGLSPAWAAFASGFFTAYGHWPEGRNVDDDFDAEFEPDEVAAA